MEFMGIVSWSIKKSPHKTSSAMTIRNNLPTITMALIFLMSCSSGEFLTAHKVLNKRDTIVYRF